MTDDRAQLAIRRKAMEAMIREAAEAYNIPVNPAAVRSIAARAAHELSLDEKGFPVGSNGRFRPMVQWLTEIQRDAPYFFFEQPGAGGTAFRQDRRREGRGQPGPGPDRPAAGDQRERDGPAPR